jgi:hypothetical protein
MVEVAWQEDRPLISLSIYDDEGNLIRRQDIEVPEKAKVTK